MSAIVNLSPRLCAAANFVPPGARVIDVGTDHARLAVYLAQSGGASHVWASDIREGPLRSAASLVARTHTDGLVELRQTDGLAGFGPADADSVVIAGMGGETIASILTAAPWLRECGALLILSPHTKQAYLRGVLLESGYIVTNETLAEDAGRIYPILTARAGEAQDVYSEAELHTGLYDQIAGQPLFPRYLDILMARARKAAAYDSSAAALLKELERMKARIAYEDSRSDPGAAVPEGPGRGEAGF